MEHVFWLEHHPRSISGLIEYLAQYDKVYCICCDDDIFENRSSMGWTNDSFFNVEFVYLTQLKSPHEFLLEFCNKHKGAVNYIMGIRSGNISKITRKYLLKSSENKIFMIAERPYFYGKGRFLSLLLRLLYFWYGFIYRDKITGVFAMGELGVDSYKSWAHGNVFPFLYPRFNDIDTYDVENISFPIRALYVGQLDYRKGIDILVDVFDKLPPQIHLDVVGANGNIQEQIKQRILDTPNVDYLGVWNSSEVAKKTSFYDLCIVPSRYDGWGMYVMEALEAGVGVITTNETGSKDLVMASGAGMIVKSNSFDSLKLVLDNVVENPEILIRWKCNARSYKNKISRDSVGKYVRDIVSSLSVADMYNVKAPWL